MADYKHFSKMYILEFLHSYFIALCLFDTHVRGSPGSEPSLWEFSGESQDGNISMAF